MAEEIPIPKITYPWTPFPGAYMAPVAESPPTSAITIANQIPGALLRNIPADQQAAYVDQWPLMNQSERAIVLQTYGTGDRTEARKPPPMAVATPIFDSSRVTLNPANGMAQNDGIPADVLARIPAAERAAYAAAWPTMGSSDRALVLDAYGTHPGAIDADLYAAMPADVRAQYAEQWPLMNDANRAQIRAYYLGGTMQAGMGGTLALLAIAAGAYFLLGRRRGGGGRRRRRA